MSSEFSGKNSAFVMNECGMGDGGIAMDKEGRDSISRLGELLIRFGFIVIIFAIFIMPIIQRVILPYWREFFDALLGRG